MTVTSIEQVAAAQKQHPAMRVLERREWSDIWKLMNAFASGKTQNQWSRVEPLAVLGEVYYLLAIIDTERRLVLKAAS